MKTKLIFVEGLPGSGKSTTAQFIWMQLQKHGVKCRWYYEEENPHPVALFDSSSVDKTATAMIPGALSRWKSFVLQAVHSDEIIIVESHLFQDNIFSLLEKDLDRPKILAFIHAITEACRCLEPVLIYLFQSDYSQTLRRICTHRGLIIERIYIALAEQSGFGQRKGVQGFPGWVQFWEAVKEITEQLFAELDIPKLAIENSAGRWHDYYRQICDFLKLPSCVEPPAEAQYLQRFVGTYTCLHKDKVTEFTIYLEDGNLVIRDFPGLWPKDRLIPKKSNVFYVASWPRELIFNEDVGGVIHSMRIEIQRETWHKLDHQNQIFPKIQ